MELGTRRTVPAAAVPGSLEARPPPSAGQEDLSKSGLYGMDSIDSLQSLGPAWQDTSWQIDPSDVEIIEDEAGRGLKLGAGGYGTVSALLLTPLTAIMCVLLSASVLSAWLPIHCPCYRMASRSASEGCVARSCEWGTPRLSGFCK